MGYYCDVGVPLHQLITRFYSEEAVELVKLGITIVENVESIDNSPPERIPHEDYIGKDLAKARLLMPIKLNCLEKRIEHIENRLINLNENITNFIDSLKITLNSNPI